MKQSFKTSIGGQALIEGVMMRGPARTAMAVRMPDGAVDVEVWETARPGAWYRKTPFVRGIFNMVDSLLTGYKCLMRSAEKTGVDEGEPGKLELWLSKRLGKSLYTVVSGLSLVLGLLIAVGLFAVLPTFLVGFAGRWVGDGALRSLLEGVVKIAIFVGYLWAVSRMPDISRVFRYHGAEHKTIACYEGGLPLTVDNVRGQARFHPRCGTSFLLIVLIVSIIVFSAIRVDATLPRVALKIALLPAVVGIAYEIVKLAGRYENVLTRAVSAPGLWLQRLTTVEPGDDQIEVAIASMEPVIPGERGQDAW